MNKDEYDIVVAGATPAGIAAAVRAAREGHSVLLTQHTQHIGGMCVNGIGQWDAKSDHRRCPIFREILESLENHYSEISGPDSPDLIAARYSISHYPVGSFEPSVMEQIFNKLTSAEKTLTVKTGFYPASATTSGRTISKVVFRAMHGKEKFTASAKIFIDATYEGDLAAVSGVPYRIGREGFDETGEPHAGRLYTRFDNNPAPSLALEGKLNTLTFCVQQGPIDPASPRSGDKNVQAYNLRPCICRDPAHRILLEKPPEHYNRSEFLQYTRKFLAISADIHGKNSCNSPILPGENQEYPEGNWPTRLRIDERHRNFMLGLMWFLQNDQSIPAEQREHQRVWGLADDEFTDNNYLPYEMYVRETRRIIGRHILTEHDFLPRAGFMRPRPFEDSIAFTDWYMDSHSCTADIGTLGPARGRNGNAEYPFEGKLILSEEFRPGMIPYRALVPENLDNMLVPVCVSSTHVAWGTVRLEPTWIHIGEAAGFAASQALKNNETVAQIDVHKLQQTLLNAGASIAFFNQHNAEREHPYYTDRQLAACRGEWDSYNLDTKGK